MSCFPNPKSIFEIARKSLPRLSKGESEWKSVTEFAANNGYSEEVVLSASVSRHPDTEKRSTKIRVLLVPKELNEPGLVGELVLTHHDVRDRPKQHAFVRSCEMLSTQVDNDFQSAFTHALAAVRSLCDTVSDDFVIAWSITCGKGHQIPDRLTGKSLGGAIALGLLRLFHSGQLLKNPPQKLADIHKLFQEDLIHWSITAEISEDGKLVFPDGMSQKLKADNCPPFIYVGRYDEKTTNSTTVTIERIPDLNTLFALLGQDKLPTLPPTHPPHHWLIRTIIILTIIALCFSVYVFWQHKHPQPIDTAPAPRPFEQIGRMAELALPEGCKQIYELRDPFDQKEWDTVILPSLKLEMHPFALIIGDPTKWVDQRNPVSLTGLASLQDLHTLTIHHSNVTSIPQIEDMKYLEHLALLGSSIVSLEKCSKLQNLRSLVLDAGFLQEYPKVYDFPNLETLILHVADKTQSVDLIRCTKLQRLCICGENLERVTGLLTLPIKELVIHAVDLAPSTVPYKPNMKFEDIDETSTQLPRDLEKLELHGCRLIQRLDLSQHHQLHELELQDTAIAQFVFGKESSLKKIRIREANELEELNCASLKFCTELSVQNAPLHTLIDLSGAPEMSKLNLDNTRVTTLPGIEKLTKLTTLSLQDTDLRNLFPLNPTAECNVNIRGTSAAKKIADILGLNGPDDEDTIIRSNVDWTANTTPSGEPGFVTADKNKVPVRLHPDGDNLKIAPFKPRQNHLEKLQEGSWNYGKGSYSYSGDSGSSYYGAYWDKPNYSYGFSYKDAKGNVFESKILYDDNGWKDSDHLPMPERFRVMHWIYKFDLQLATGSVPNIRISDSYYDAVSKSLRLLVSPFGRLDDSRKWVNSADFPELDVSSGQGGIGSGLSEPRPPPIEIDSEMLPAQMGARADSQK